MGKKQPPHTAGWTLVRLYCVQAIIMLQCLPGCFRLGRFVCRHLSVVRLGWQMIPCMPFSRTAQHVQGLRNLSSVDLLLCYQGLVGTIMFLTIAEFSSMSRQSSNASPAARHQVTSQPPAPGSEVCLATPSPKSLSRQHTSLDILRAETSCAFLVVACNALPRESSCWSNDPARSAQARGTCTPDRMGTIHVSARYQISAQHLLQKFDQS